MIEIKIPGFKEFKFQYLVLDFNGTIAADGEILPGVKEKLRDLSAELEIIVLTADTFGRAAEKLKGLPLKLEIIPKENQKEYKGTFVKDLGGENVFAIGNGFNDIEMLKNAGVGVVLVQKEGASSQAVIAADIVSYSIVCSLGFLLKPKRLIATLRR